MACVILVDKAEQMGGLILVCPLCIIISLLLAHYDALEWSLREAQIKLRPVVICAAPTYLDQTMFKAAPQARKLVRSLPDFVPKEALAISSRGRSRPRSEKCGVINAISLRQAHASIHRI